MKNYHLVCSFSLLFCSATLQASSVIDATDPSHKKALVTIHVTGPEEYNKVLTLHTTVNNASANGSLTKPDAFQNTKEHTYIHSSVQRTKTNADNTLQKITKLTPGTVSEGVSGTVLLKQEKDERISGKMTLSVSRLIAIEPVQSDEQFVQLPQMDSHATTLSLKEGTQTKNLGPYTVKVTVGMNNSASKVVKN